MTTNHAAALTKLRNTLMRQQQATEATIAEIAYHEAQLKAETDRIRQTPR